MLTDDTIRAALRDCYDPEIPLNVIDLGLVQRVELAQDPDAPGAGIPGVPTRFRVRVELIPTSQEEGPVAQLCAQIANRLAGLEGVSGTIVEILEEPVWTPARISREGRRILKMDQPAFPILNNRVR